MVISFYKNAPFWVKSWGRIVELVGDLKSHLIQLLVQIQDKLLKKYRSLGSGGLGASWGSQFDSPIF